MIFTSDKRMFQIKHPILKDIVKDIIEVPIVDFEGARMKNCILNAKDYSRKNNGAQVVTGFLFSSLGNVLLRIVGHAVVLENGVLKCVTPPEEEYIRQRGTQYFLPSDIEITNGRLPMGTISMVANPEIERFAQLENLIFEIKKQHPARELLDSKNSHIAISEKYIKPYNDAMKEMKRLIPIVEKLALVSMHRNNLCHCGSGKKYKSCCI